MDRLISRVHWTCRCVVGQAWIMLLPIAAALVQPTRRFAITLVFEEPLHESFARIGPRLFLFAAARQYYLRLHLDQQAGDFQKVAHIIDIKLREQIGRASWRE